MQDAAFNYGALGASLSAATDDTALFNAIVNVPFGYPVPAALLFLGIIVLLQVDSAKKTIDRIALSATDFAHLTTTVTPVPFSTIKIPLDYYDNSIAQAIATGEPTDTTDWRFLFEPAMTADQARVNQANAGIAYSAVYPLTARSGGALIFSYYQYQHEIGVQQMDFMRCYSAIVDQALKD